MKKKGCITALLIIIILFLVLILGVFGFIIWKGKKNIEQDSRFIVPTPTVEEVTPPSTGSATIKPITATPTPTLSDLDQIKEAFAKKYNHTPQETIVTISKNDGNHISGGIKFEGEMSGGWFLAAKSNNNWVIVQDGNGTIDCAVIAPYKFSSAMVPECWDSKSQTLIKR